MKKLLIFLLIATLMMIALSGCATPTEAPTEPPSEPEQAEPVEEPAEPAEPEEAAEPGVIKIGVALSMTGGLAAQGGNLKDGYDFWANTINEMGGIQVGDQKYLVELIYYDDASDTQTSVKLTEKLITEEHGKFLNMLDDARQFITQQVPATKRKELLAKLANDNSYQLFLDKGSDAWKSMAQKLIADYEI